MSGVVVLAGTGNSLVAGVVCRAPDDVVEIQGDECYVGAVTLDGGCAAGYNLNITAGSNNAIGTVNSYPVAGSGALLDGGTATRTL